jgi:murein DD-endopeptidase MepM/ murein hydrolase activator NlpD
MREENLSPLRPVVPPQEWGPGYEIWQSFRNLLTKRDSEGSSSLVRVGSHIMLVLVALGVLAFSRLTLPGWDIVRVRQETADVAPEDMALTFDAAEAPAADQEIALERRAVPFTLIPERARTEIITHTVVAGDTLYALAKEYGVGAETLMWANNMDLNPDLLRLGQKLIVLPVNGVYHTVGAKDTLTSIAKQYKVTADAIIAYEPNHIDVKNPVIHAGEKLIVPGGRKPVVVKQALVYGGPVPASASKGTGRFVWPTTGYITQGYKPLHRAIDIAGSIGRPVKASDSGYVVEAGWSNSGYGNFIVIDHRNGYQTLYGHLSRIMVSPGQSVGKGATIGLMGSTGRSTGPHLHFEIRQRGVTKNPFSFLP